MHALVNGKDLTKEPPRSPNTIIGGYAILGRTLDKCRALLAGEIAEYHFNCPLDRMLFEWKGIDAEDFKAAVAEGNSDEQMAAWVDQHGEPKSAEEKKRWVAEVKKSTLYNDPEKRDFFIKEARKLGLDPTTTTLFQWLDADDRASYPTTS